MSGCLLLLPCSHCCLLTLTRTLAHRCASRTSTIRRRSRCAGCSLLRRCAEGWRQQQLCVSLQRWRRSGARWRTATSAFARSCTIRRRHQLVLTLNRWKKRAALSAALAATHNAFGVWLTRLQRRHTMRACAAALQRWQACQIASERSVLLLCRVAVDARLRLLAAATWRWRVVAAKLALSVVSAASAARLVQLSLRARRTTIRRLLRLWKVVHVKFAFCAWAAVCELETARSRAFLRAWVTYRRRTLGRGWARWSAVDAELRKDAWEQLQAPRLHGLVGSRRQQVRGADVAAHILPLCAPLVAHSLITPLCLLCSSP